MTGIVAGDLLMLELEVHEIDWLRREYVLTKTELEVLRFLISAKSSKQIAREMGVCLPTVAAHRANLRRKLGVKNIAGIFGAVYGPRFKAVQLQSDQA